MMQHSVNKVDHLPNATTKNAITFLYLSAFSPAISTLTKAIQNEFFNLWPGLTVDAINKYVANMPRVSAGRMNHAHKNVRSTKLQQVLNTILHDLRPGIEYSPTSKNSDILSTNEF